MCGNLKKQNLKKRLTQDHLGSPIRLTNNDIYNHALVYDEFGIQDVVTVQKNNLNPFGFTGYQTDNITDMYYAQVRYYTPPVARFTAQDIAIPFDINTYACRTLCP